MVLTMSLVQTCPRLWCGTESATANLRTRIKSNACGSPSQCIRKRNEVAAVMKPQVLAGVHCEGLCNQWTGICVYSASQLIKRHGWFPSWQKLMSDNILQAAHLDYQIYLRLAGVIDLIVVVVVVVVVVYLHDNSVQNSRKNIRHVKQNRILKRSY